MSVKELFFTLGVVNSFTLSVVGLSVDVSQLPNALEKSKIAMSVRKRLSNDLAQS